MFNKIIYKPNRTTWWDQSSDKEPEQTRRDHPAFDTPDSPSFRRSNLLSFVRRRWYIRTPPPIARSFRERRQPISRDDRENQRRDLRSDWIIWWIGSCRAERCIRRGSRKETRKGLSSVMKPLQSPSSSLTVEPLHMNESLVESLKSHSWNSLANLKSLQVPLSYSEGFHCMIFLFLIFYLRFGLVVRYDKPN